MDVTVQVLQSLYAEAQAMETIDPYRAFEIYGDALDYSVANNMEGPRKLLKACEFRYVLMRGKTITKTEVDEELRPKISMFNAMKDNTAAVAALCRLYAFIMAYYYMQGLETEKTDITAVKALLERVKLEKAEPADTVFLRVLLSRLEENHE